jgi:hypothetical protein
VDITLFIREERVVQSVDILIQRYEAMDGSKEK